MTDPILQEAEALLARIERDLPHRVKAIPQEAGDGTSGQELAYAVDDIRSLAAVIRALMEQLQNSRASEIAWLKSYREKFREFETRIESLEAERDIWREWVRRSVHGRVPTLSEIASAVERLVEQRRKERTP